MTSIGVILPTRGLIFTKVLEALHSNLQHLTYQLYFSHDKKIPECENYLVDKALQDGHDYLLFVEEDTVMPERALYNMILSGADIACVEYGVAGYSTVTKSKQTNEVLWCGLGCTLVKAKVFATLDKPYFRSDKALLLNYWPEVTWVQTGAQAYGGQDIYFCVTARQQGNSIYQVPGECEHLKLEELGRKEVNYGLHQIGRKSNVEKRQTL